MTEPTQSMQSHLVGDEGAWKSHELTLARVPTLYAIASIGIRGLPQLGGRKSPTEIIKPSEFRSAQSP